MVSLWKHFLCNFSLSLKANCSNCHSRITSRIDFVWDAVLPPLPPPSPRFIQSIFDDSILCYACITFWSMHFILFQCTTIEPFSHCVSAKATCFSLRWRAIEAVSLLLLCNVTWTHFPFKLALFSKKNKLFSLLCHRSVGNVIYFSR